MKEKLNDVLHRIGHGPGLVTVWVAGALLLLGLNIRRDVSRIAKNFTWHTVESKKLYRSVSSAGVMEAIRVAELKSEVEETVLKKLVQEGQAVQEGQPLMELSRTRTQLEYEQRRNSYRNSEADYKKAVQEEKVQTKLYQDRAVSRSQLEDAVRNKEKAKSSLDIAARELALVEKKLEGTLVRSPITGVVLKERAGVGTAVSPGKDLIVVGDISRFLIRTKVDELDIKQIRVGQPVDVEADAYPGQKMKGEVRAIASQAEREAFAKVEVIIDIIDAAGLELKHNLSVRVRILTEEIPNAIGIPIRAIHRKKGDVAWVYVQNSANLVREKRVKLGRPAGEDIEVVEGLREGARVGTPNLEDREL